MEGGTVTRADIALAIQMNVGLSKAESMAFVGSIIEEICNALQRDGVVKITGFGTFYVSERSERIGRNPSTGVLVPIAPRKALCFRPSDALKTSVAASVS